MKQENARERIWIKAYNIRRKANARVMDQYDESTILRVEQLMGVPPYEGAVSLVRDWTEPYRYGFVMEPFAPTLRS